MMHLAQTLSSLMVLLLAVVACQHPLIEVVRPTSQPLATSPSPDLPARPLDAQEIRPPTDHSAGPPGRIDSVNLPVVPHWVIPAELQTINRHLIGLTTSLKRLWLTGSPPLTAELSNPPYLSEPVLATDQLADSLTVRYQPPPRPIAETQKVTEAVTIAPVTTLSDSVTLVKLTPPARSDSPTPTPRSTSPPLGSMIAQLIGPTPTPGETTIPITPQERLNILLIGADQRGTDVGRSDTIMMLTINPVSKTVGLLSIPRDLWVTIPGRGARRINGVYRLGEQKSPQGGGVVLIKETLAANFGLEADYYAQINFAGFEQAVDLLGGIEIDVPKSINAAAYYGYTPQYIHKTAHYSFVPARTLEPDGRPKANVWQMITQTVIIDNDSQLATLGDEPGYRMLYLEAGRQHIDGETALQYARSRASVTADFARMERQQAILVAIWQQALQTNLLAQVPQLWTTWQKVVQTDLTIVEIFRLAQLAPEITPENIHLATIDYTMTTDYVTPEGARVLLPLPDKIKAVTDEMFGPVASSETP